jgi:hypothetical protein
MDAAKELVGEGKAANINEALDKIQKDKEAGLDKDTKNNVEAGRKQQAAAMTMDSVVKTFNISAKLNAEATDKFNDAVNKFADTVGAKKPVGGVPQTSGTGQPVTNAAPPTAVATTNRINAEQSKVEATQRLESAKPGSDDAKQAQKDLEKARSRVDQTIKIEDTSKTNDSLARLKKEGFGTRSLSVPTEQKDKAKEPASIPTEQKDKTKQPASIPTEQKDKAKEPVTIPTKEKHSAASLKKMGLPLKEGDVQGEGRELDTRLIDIAKKAKDTIPGFSTITAFNDNFHNESGRKKSQHTEGAAFDFKLNYKPTIEQGKEVVNMLKGIGAGYALDEYNFPSPGSNGQHIHAQLAQDGGEFNGPKSGYPVMLHDKEIVLNKIQSDKLKQKLEQVEKKPVESAIPGLSTTSSNTTSNSNTEVVAMLKEFTNVMENKMDNMIGVLSDGNDISGKILTYSMA